MNELDSISDAIQASLTNFTKQFEEVSSDQFHEMRKCSFFDPVPGDCLARIAMESEIRRFGPGEYITREGDPMKAFHVLMYGTAKAFVHDLEVGTIHSGECIGEGTFFGEAGMSRSATVITDSDAIVLEISKSAVDRMEGDVKTYMNKALLIALFRKLQAANKRIEDLLQGRSLS
jgi:CRP-like cAMP-binding protein